jgi:predicted aspartyl protease
MKCAVESEEMGRVTVSVILTNLEDELSAQAGLLPAESVRRLETEAIVDTGATKLVLPQAIVDQLGLAVRGDVVVRYADHRSATRQVARNVKVEVLGRDGVFSAVVEPSRDNVLLGAIVLEEFDLLVDCPHQTLRPRDPDHIIAEIE